MPRPKSATAAKERETDHWRVHNWNFIIGSNPAEYTTYHECDKETCDSKFYGIVYAIYHGQGHNKIYFGSTLQGHKKRLAYHLDDAYVKMSRSLFHTWLRCICPTREEAEAVIRISVVHKVYFQPYTTMKVKNRVLVELESKYINDYFSSGRLLNEKLISKENRLLIPHLIRENKLLKYSIQLKIKDVIDTFKEEGMTDGLRALEELRVNLLGGVTEEEE